MFNLNFDFCCELLICPVVLLPKEGDMKPTKPVRIIDKIIVKDEISAR